MGPVTRQPGRQFDNGRKEAKDFWENAIIEREINIANAATRIQDTEEDHEALIKKLDDQLAKQLEETHLTGECLFKTNGKMSKEFRKVVADARVACGQPAQSTASEDNEAWWKDWKREL